MQAAIGVVPDHKIPCEKSNTDGPVRMRCGVFYLHFQLRVALHEEGLRRLRSFNNLLVPASSFDTIAVERRPNGN